MDALRDIDIALNLFWIDLFRCYANFLSACWPHALLSPRCLLAQDTAEVLGDVMSISLKDVVKPGIGFQGALQGLGTPNQAGISGFLPLSVGENSVWYLDALVNVHFGDRDGYSSIINTDVADDFQHLRVWATAG